jgi:hypothetical protein
MLPDGLNRRSLGNPLIKQALAFSELQAISLTKGGRHAVQRCFKSSVFRRVIFHVYSRPTLNP